MPVQLFRLLPAPQLPMEPTDVINPDAIKTDDRTELNRTHFPTALCREEIAAYPVHEMMHVIPGSVMLTHSVETVDVFGPGDTVFIPKGAPCTWEITERLWKFYMIVE